MLNHRLKKKIVEKGDQSKGNIKKCKLITLFLGAVCVMFSLCSCHQKNIYIKEESFYSDFKVENGKVYIYCRILIENLTGTEKEVALEASFENDVKNGLLKEAILKGYSINEGTKIFRLQKGENQFNVVFVGEHAGGNQKHDRALPNIKIIA